MDYHVHERFSSALKLHDKHFRPREVEGLRGRERAWGREKKKDGEGGEGGERTWGKGEEG